MATFRFCFIVEIIEETNQKMTFEAKNAISLSSILRGVDGQMQEADEKCDLLMKDVHDKYFPDVHIELDGNGYNVSDRIRENFYIISFTNITSARSFLEKIDKILYDYRDSDSIRVPDNTAYINREFFAKKVTDFGHDLVAYDMLKNLNL